MGKKHFIKLIKPGLIEIVYASAILVFILTSNPVNAAKTEVVDKTISDSVEDELVIDSGVRAAQIDVFTIDGIVTLKGTVDNVLAKERAARIARIVKGVRAVVNEIKVVPPLLYNDSQIKEEVKDALSHDPATEVYDVKVDVSNNIVVLTGTVQSWKEKDLCENVAKGVKGVMGLENRIDVVWPKKRTDSEIKKEIEETLEWDIFVDNGLITVNVSKGRVELKGTVGSAAEKYAATEDSYVNGVKSVDSSKLKVARWARDRELKGNKYSTKTVMEIKEAVKDALLYDPRVSIFDITVEVAPESNVVLRGEVDNLKARRSAAQDAKNTVGVLSVENRLKVRPSVKISDNKIKDEIKAAFRRDPYLLDYDISLKTVNGGVKLFGLVDTAFEKAQAEDVVSRVKGVISVDNNLIVRDFSNTFTFDPWVNDYYLYDFYWYNNLRRFPEKSDPEILKGIKNELFWSPFVDADKVDVKVKDGIATLTGKVDSWLAYNVAMQNAYKGGAIYVYNHLTVQ